MVGCRAAIDGDALREQRVVDAALTRGTAVQRNAGVVHGRHHVLEGGCVEGREHEVAHEALRDTDGVGCAEAGERRRW